MVTYTQLKKIIADHSELTSLDYASSGHTGFQPSGDYVTESEFTTASGVLDDKIVKNITYVDGQTIASGVGTVGKAYYLTSTDDTWLAADKTVESTVSGRLGVCSDTNTIIYSGLVVSAGHGLGVNSLPLYVNTSGTITASIPNVAGEFIKQVGFIEDSNTLNIQMEENYYELGDLIDTPNVLATQAEAEAGINNTAWMSPLRTSQAMDTIVIDQTISSGVGTVGKAYYLTSTDDTWLPCDKTDEATVSGLVGVCAMDNTIMFRGLVSSTAHGLGANGLFLYVDSAGSLSTTSTEVDGEFLKLVGTVEDIDNIRVNIDPDYYEIGEVMVGDASSRFDHGTITSGTPATINATNYTEHIGNFSESWDLTLEGFNEAHPTTFFRVTSSGGPNTITVVSGSTIVWPLDQTLNFTDINDGTYAMVFDSTDDGTNITISIRQEA